MPTLVRTATPDDAENACECLRRSIVECCVADHGGDPRVIDAWLHNKTPTNVSAWLGSPGAYAVVAVLDGETVGVAMLGGDGSVALCYLVPEARFRGAGKAMLTALEAEAKGRGFAETTLFSTRTAHPFYLRNGYVDTGLFDEAFGMTAPQMCKRLID